MRIPAIALLLALSACASPHLVERRGDVVPFPIPQAAEQCAAQPDLDWCRHEAR